MNTSIKSNFQFLFSRTTSKIALKALYILILGLVLTGTATYYAHKKVKSDLKQNFDLNCNEIKIKTANRLRACAQLLETGSALFAASDSVTRLGWKTFCERSKYEKYLPGIQGIGFSIIIHKNQLERHIQKIRNEGFPDYLIKPVGDRPIYTSIIYLEPFSVTNIRAFGYDMYSDSVRRKAMELSRDSDIAVLSGKVRLLQNAPGDSQPGALMYLPVYRNGMPVKTVEQRRAAIIGWVYTPYHLDDLIDGLLGHWNTERYTRIRLQLYDEYISPDRLLYDSQKGAPQIISNSPFLTDTMKIKPNVKKWLLLFSQPNHQISYFQNLDKLVLSGGTLVSVLIFLLSLSLLNTRVRAKQIAIELTIGLRESEERIREVLENSSDASYKRNLKTHSYEYLSPAYTRISGYSPDEMKNMPIKTILGFFHPDDITEVNRTLAQSMIDASPASYQLEYRFRHKDGHYRWLNDKYTIIRDSQNQPAALIGSVSDITNRKQIEVALKDERLLLRTLIDNIPDSIYCLDLECRKTLANLTDLKYMGAKSEAEVIGKNDFDFYPKEIADKFFEVDNSVIQTRKPLLNVEEYLIDTKGEIKWLLTSKIPMFNNEGQITGLLGYGRDITERKYAEEEIKAKNEELQRLNAAKDKFFSIIAHDLRSPFNGFLGLTQMMAEDLHTMTLEEIQTIAVSMKDSANKLYRLLENLLQWSSMQQNRTAFNPELMSLNPVITDSIGMVMQMAQSKKIEISCLISDDINVFADMHMLQTILRNLVSNSVKFTPRGGKIDLSATINENEFTEIAIRDDGIGMNKEMLDGLFQLDVNTSRKGTDGENSTGLGLIICKDFVEKNGGKIRVISQEGKGSTFYFTMPSRSV